MLKQICIALAVLMIFAATAVAWQPETCKSCHLEQYEIWNSSAHADSLKAAGGSVVDIESCTECHVESSIKETWGREDVETTIEPITCEVCHLPPEVGYDAHLNAPSDHLPEVTLSAELCGNCHRDSHHPVIEEWNEFDSSGFNMTATASHSEPTDIAEPYILGMDNECVACKATDGAIPNLADPEVFGLNLDEVPEPAEVSEWRITCVACHEPHSADYRIEDDAQLCGNCHNSEHAIPDGMTPAVRHPQWEMYNGSIYDTGIHPGDLGCSDCHMAAREYNDTTQEAAITGHTFDFDPELLFSSTSSNGCYDCHQEGFIVVVEAKQEIVTERLDELATLKTNATVSLEELNGTSGYDAALEDYNNALFYMTAVESDGSHGIHNMEKVKEYLDNSEELFNAVITRPETVAQPGFEAILGVIGLFAVLWIVKKRE
ncbi:nitrate reductase cytochrome c-type subunit [Methanohalophilus levihalophilus]|uniref:ammonia-forming cytochrome c nitrite reductase subunit c552 n=1 Tax=Methanohalophilus levihalophilus TaxID=1431282 RepID=UPI001AE23FD6|nr:ammonia-forming cytochrome c nitrite reductase subunit c552 [Methanohalophilus levihalophilus]MBP2029495.1 nitrate reductase cytochrome c-type subunit [Methanohalophilus levihalophilus]